MAQELWGLRKAVRGAEDDLLFPGEGGRPLDGDNFRSRVWNPATTRAGVPWATFHTTRHTCASLLFRHGLNAKQVQRWLGHATASFTLDTYVHLLPGDLIEAGCFDALTGGQQRATDRATGTTETGRNGEVMAEDSYPAFAGSSLA